MMCGPNCCCPAHKVAAALVWIGAINWGLVGFFNWNLVHALFGMWPMVERVIYAVVGLCALFMCCRSMCKRCKMCDMKGGDKMMGGSDMKKM